MPQYPSNIDLSSLNGSTGFRLSGVSSFDQSGMSVASAGDVNGDGFDDVIVGAISADAEQQFFGRELCGVRQGVRLRVEPRPVEPRRQHRLQAQRRCDERRQRLVGSLGGRRQRRRLRRPDRRRLCRRSPRQLFGRELRGVRKGTGHGRGPQRHRRVAKDLGRKLQRRAGGARRQRRSQRQWRPRHADRRRRQQQPARRRGRRRDAGRCRQRHLLCRRRGRPGDGGRERRHRYGPHDDVLGPGSACRDPDRRLGRGAGAARQRPQQHRHRRRRQRRAQGRHRRGLHERRGGRRRDLCRRRGRLRQRRLGHRHGPCLVRFRHHQQRRAAVRQRGQRPQPGRQRPRQRHPRRRRQRHHHRHRRPGRHDRRRRQRHVRVRAAVGQRDGRRARPDQGLRGGQRQDRPRGDRRERGRGQRPGVQLHRLGRVLAHRGRTPGQARSAPTRWCRATSTATARRTSTSC